MNQPLEITPDEPSRLQALRAMSILDTPLEERFERLTRLAMRLLGTPVAAISLVDADRQYFKSIQGLESTGWSREQAFCAHTILQDGVMIVPDARVDPRFQNYSCVSGEPGIVFYAGHPLSSPEGYHVGSFCVVDNRPRAWSQEDSQCLMDLARLAEAELANAARHDATRAVIHSMTSEQCCAAIDPLTRLWNQDGVTKALDRALSPSFDHGTACVLLDVDNLAAINSRHGNDAGDAVLRAVGKRLLASIRESDSVGRMSGDEFLLVLTPCADQEQAQDYAQSIASRVADAPIKTRAGVVKASATTGLRYAPPGRGTLVHTMVADAARDLAQKSVQLRRAA